MTMRRHTTVGRATREHARAQAESAIETARRRFGAMMRGDSPRDIFFQAFVGAVCAATVVRAVRYTPINAIVSSIAPLAAFALLYRRLTEENG